MKGRLTRDEGGDLWVYIAPHHTGYWKFVDADDNWVDRGMALQVTGDAAALFAAAPELLATLKEVAEECEYRLRKGEDSGDRHTLKLCRAAISKAEGSA
jgi:hypothetical protein